MLCKIHEIKNSDAKSLSKVLSGGEKGSFSGYNFSGQDHCAESEDTFRRTAHHEPLPLKESLGVHQVRVR